MMEYNRLSILITLLLATTAHCFFRLNANSFLSNSKTSKNLDAIVIKNTEGRQSIEESLGNSDMFSGIIFNNEDEEDEEEDAGYYFERTSVFEYAYDNGTDYETTANQTTQAITNQDLIMTAEGVDPNDPEEIARKKHYGASIDIFDQIVAVNKNSFTATNLLEGDVKPRIIGRNAGGGGLWPKTRFGNRRGLVQIPYVISPQYNSTHISIIRSAMQTYAKYTCVRFVPRRREHAYISVNDANGCWAFVGKTGFAAQAVSLGIPGCMTKGIALHELMHAVGFQHEHSRNDRDNFVRILRDNIQGGMEDNFDKHSFTQNLVIYDYGSVMHYTKNAFAKQPYLPTIEIYPKRNPEPTIGQRDRLSPYDIEEIKYLYNCDSQSYQRCGTDFDNVAVGSFRSPSYPNAYQKESHCTWNITVRPGSYVRIFFRRVNIFDSPLCVSDAILIHDGKNASAPVLKRICGNHTIVNVTSTGRHLFVIFSSDGIQRNYNGFRAVFKQVQYPGRKPALVSRPVLPPITSTIGRFYCNFDTSLCGMTQDTWDKLDYIRYRGSTPSSGTGPSADHTSGTGYYVYVESSLPVQIGDNAILRTPWFAHDSRYCITFSYHMFGSYMGGLRLYALEKVRNDNYGQKVLLWEAYGNKGNKWFTKKFAYVPQNRNVEFVQFYWEIFVYYYQSDIALDDVIINPGSCSNPITLVSQSLVLPETGKSASILPTDTFSPIPTTTTTTPEPIQIYTSVNCTFDHGLCGFTQNSSDDFDWNRNREKTPSASTGPTEDHTTGQGYYMFVEASSPRETGDKARLVSPLLTPTGHCLHMWYHMYGKQTGRLEIWQILNGEKTLLAERVGDSGNHWLSLSVDVNTPNFRRRASRRDQGNNVLLRPLISEDEFLEPEIILQTERNAPNDAISDTLTVSETTDETIDSSNLQIYIEATIGQGFAGDTAIDDVVITDAPCEQMMPPTENPLLDSFSCDFETDSSLCGLIQMEDDDFDWLPNSGSTSSSATGPDFDNTRKNESGVYLYTESSAPRRVNDVTKLITPQLQPSQFCIQFAYHMYGSATGELQILSLEELPGGIYTNPERIWRMAGPQGQTWHTASIQYSPSDAVQAQAVQFIFYGMIGESYTSDMALDDVSITLGRCPTEITLTTSSTPKSTTSTVSTTTTIQPSSTTTSTTSTAATTQTSTTRSSTTTTLTSMNSLSTTSTNPPSTTSITSSSIAVTSTASTRTSTSPSLRPTNYLSVFSCDFEPATLCSMIQSNNDRFNWELGRGPTTSSRTGPTHDHTVTQNGQGYYIFTEASSPQRENHDAILSTPPLSVNTPKRCLVFWYNMWGSGMGTLTVSAVYSSQLGQSSGVNQINRTIFSVNGNQSQDWIMARVEIDQELKLHGRFLQISFRGIRGNTFLSDMAIDDICVAEGPCDYSSRCTTDGVLLDARPKTTTTTTTTTTTSTTGTVPSLTPRVTTTKLLTTTTSTSLTTTTRAKPAIRIPTLWSGLPLCTFERKPSGSTQSNLPPMPNDPSQDLDLGDYVYPRSISRTSMCGWRQVRSGQDQFDWTRIRGPTPSKKTGPSADKTTGRGFYMYIEASDPRVENDEAYLQSYPMQPSDYCLDVNFHMYGVFTGRLTIRSLQKLTNGRSVSFVLGNRAGNRGNRWRNLRVNYTPRADALFVAFRIIGTVGADYRSDIAVDDITVMPGTCEACNNPSVVFTDDSNRNIEFATGCIEQSLFWVRCCSTNQVKTVYRRVKKCNAGMFTGARLQWYCANK